MKKSQEETKARRKLRHAMARLKLTLDIPTLTGTNFYIPKHTQERITKNQI